jgi:hypothetical protein
VGRSSRVPPQPYLTAIERLKGFQESGNAFARSDAVLSMRS